MNIEFIVNKENGIHQLIFQIPFTSRIFYDDKEKMINYPFRVINNKYGKIILLCDCNPVYQQIIMTNTNLLPSKKHIDFNFLNDVYLPKIKELLNACPQAKELLSFNIVVIAEGKSFELFNDDYIKEDDTLLSTMGIASMYIALESLYVEHGKKFLQDVFYSFSENSYDFLFPAIYINTETFKPVLIGRKAYDCDYCD